MNTTTKYAPTNAVNFRYSLSHCPLFSAPKVRVGRLDISANFPMDEVRGRKRFAADARCRDTSLEQVAPYSVDSTSRKDISLPLEIDWRMHGTTETGSRDGGDWHSCAPRTLKFRMVLCYRP